MKQFSRKEEAQKLSVCVTISQLYFIISSKL